VGYGIRTATKALEFKAYRCSAQQYIWGEAGFDNQANRSAIGFDMNTADFILDHCVANYCAIPFYKGTYGVNWQTANCHFYNGALVTVTDANAIYTCKIDGPDGGIMTNTYNDRGTFYINADDLTSATGGRFQLHTVSHTGGGQNDHGIILYTETASNDLGGLSLIGHRFPIASGNIDFQTGGSGSFASALYWTFWDVVQEDGTKADGPSDMLNMHGHMTYDGGGTFGFGLFTNVTINSPKIFTLMADFDNNSNAADSELRLGVDGTTKVTLNPSTLAVNTPITGTAITQSTTDVTAGRLLTTVAGPAQAFRRGNILGAVSQGSGVPTGAVIEQGSNANGSYTKFADGTMVCWHTLTAATTNNAHGQLFRSATATWTFPVAFISAPAIQLGGAQGDGWPKTYPAISTTVDHRLMSGVTDATSRDYGLTAIGRWF